MHLGRDFWAKLDLDWGRSFDAVKLETMLYKVWVSRRGEPAGEAATASSGRGASGRGGLCHQHARAHARCSRRRKRGIPPTPSIGPCSAAKR